MPENSFCIPEDAPILWIAVTFGFSFPCRSPPILSIAFCTSTRYWAGPWRTLAKREGAMGVLPDWSIEVVPVGADKSRNLMSFWLAGAYTALVSPVGTNLGLS